MFISKPLTQQPHPPAQFQLRDTKLQRKLPFLPLSLCSGSTVPLTGRAFLFTNSYSSFETQLFPLLQKTFLNPCLGEGPFSGPRRFLFTPL